MAIFGSATPISKIVTDGFPLYVAAGLRMAVGFVALAPFLVKRDEFDPRRLERQDFYVLAGVAVLGMVGFSLLMLLGMQRVSGVVGSIVMSTTPAVTAAGAALFLGEHLDRFKLAAIALAVVGVLILQLSSGGDGGAGGFAIAGAAMVFGAVCCEACYTLLGKLASERLPPIALAGGSALLAGMLFAPLAATQVGELDAPDLASWAALVWWGAGVLGLGSVLWYRGVRQVEGSTAAGFMGVMPVSALVLSYLLLGEAFVWTDLLGFAAVFAGVLLVAWSHAKEADSG